MKWPDDFINKVICGDSLEILKKIPDHSIDLCITSPPYWGLRDYGLGPDQLGYEPTPELYIDHLTEIFNEVKRTLKKEGTFWLNIFDTYSGSGKGYGDKNPDPKYKKGGRQRTIKPMKINIRSKSLCMIPERLAWSLIKNNWILRNKIPWIKPNCMPFPGKDRYTNKWEYVFLFVKSRKYYFDLDSVREAHLYDGRKDTIYKGTARDQKIGNIGTHERWRNKKGKNPGDIWIVPTQPCPVKNLHYAAFPEKLCERAILPGCPKNGIVLDPFAGIGTSGKVAKELGRRFIMIDIKKEYCEAAEKEIKKVGFQMKLKEGL